jgi:hypothetical protein
VTRSLLVTATLALVAVALPGDAQLRAIDAKRSTVTVHVFKSGLFRAFADDHVIEAPLAEGSLDDSATSTVRIAIDVRGMHVLDPGLSPHDRREVQPHMLGPEVLDADRFPHIRFRSVAIQREVIQIVVGPRRARSAWLDASGAAPTRSARRM